MEKLTASEGDIIQVQFTEMGGGKDSEKVEVVEITDRYVTLNCINVDGGLEYEFAQDTLYATSPMKGREAAIGSNVDFSHIE